MIRVVRVDLDRLLVLRLRAALKRRVGQVEAVLVDLDVRADVVRTAVASAREVVVRLLVRVRVGVVARPGELERRESRKQALLLGVHLVVDADGTGMRLRNV